MDKVTSAVKVLVVDDQPLIVEELCEFLESSGYRCVPCESSQQAVQRFSDDPQIGLVLCDLHMPDMDGIELVTLVRRDNRLRSLPVMVVSYKDREEDRRRGLDAGADYYLAKASFHDEALLDAVQVLIGEAQG